MGGYEFMAHKGILNKMKQFSNVIKRGYFKVGEDDSENSVRISFRNYLYYMQGQAKVDDSPLYIFEPNFRWDKKCCQSRKLELLNHYTVPIYFGDDIFALAGGKRPPYRWFVCGPERSGTK